MTVPMYARPITTNITTFFNMKNKLSVQMYISAYNTVPKESGLPWDWSGLLRLQSIMLTCQHFKKYEQDHIDRILAVRNVVHTLVMIDGVSQTLL